jgi:hypothetical protein
MDPSMPRKFFEQHVMPSYEEWLRHPLDKRLAKSAVQEANNLAAHVFLHWKNRDPSKVYGAEREGQYRDELVTRECPDFALVRDVAEAHKHVKLERKSRLITRYDQTAVKDTVFEEGVFEEGIFEGEILVTLDDGSTRPLAEILGNVMTMWGRLLEHCQHS